MIGDLGLEGWCHVDGLVKTHEVVVEERDRQAVLQHLGLLGEGLAGESPVLHADIEVLTLRVAGGNAGEGGFRVMTVFLAPLHLAGL